jgi:YesN/AraC family two-component response regulator
MKPAILLVDDDKTVLDSLLYQLKTHFGYDYHYEIAASAEEAKEILEELQQNGNDIRLIITDWLMPETKGDSFLVDIHGQYPDTHLLMLSGYADQDSIDRARETVNLAAYIQKPWEEQELVTTVKQLLG